MRAAIEALIGGRREASSDGALLATNEWRAECPSFVERTLDDNVYVYRQGDVLEHVFGVVEGQVRLSRTGRFEEEVAFAILGAGEPFGPGLAGGERARESAVTRGPTRLCEVSLEDFGRLIRRRPELGERLIRSLAQRGERLAERLQRAAALPVWDRVVATLLDLVTRYGAACAHGHEIDVRLSPRELADLSASDEGQVLWVLNDLKWRRLVRYGQKHICVARLNHLERVALDARQPSPGGI